MKECEQMKIVPIIKEDCRNILCSDCYYNDTNRISFEGCTQRTLLYQQGKNVLNI